MMNTVEEILGCLNREKIRCTYGAVAKILSDVSGKLVIPLNVGKKLGKRCRKASWVVNKKTREPTGYREDQKHPDLYRTAEIIETGDALRKLCGQNWTARRSARCSARCSELENIV